MTSRTPHGPGEALSFLLDVAEAEGGLCERSRDSSLLLLPRPARDRLDLDEEVIVTSDPETAREDGALLVVHGHPVIDRAASLVLDRGDVGLAHFPWPVSAPPGADEIVRRARETIQVDHGRIDPAGTPPMEVSVPVLRLGVLVSYAPSLEDRFQECEEVWVDATDGRPLGDGLRAWLQSRTPDAGRGQRPQIPADLPRAIRGAHQLIEARATARQAELARQTRRTCEDETARAAAYYRGILESLERRKAGATPEQAAVLAAKAEVTLGERERRLAEIVERNQARHELRPFRLHLVGLPGLTVLATVRRGDRSYPLALTWLLGGLGLRAPTCPHCGAAAPLIAGRERLGCAACQPRKVMTVAEPPSKVVKEAVPKPVGGEAATGTRPKEEAPFAPAVRRAHPAPPARLPAPVRAGPDRRSPGTAAGSKARPDTADPVQRAISEVGGALAGALIDAAVRQAEWAARSVRKDSPMSALLRLYGSPGALWAIGVPPRAVAYEMVVLGTRLEGDTASTSGALDTSVGRRPFTLRWNIGRQPTKISELLPYRSPDGRLRELGQLPRGVALVMAHPPAPSVPLDPVASEVWRLALELAGLHLAVRSLALWWEIRPGFPRGSAVEAVAQSVVNVTSGAAGLQARPESQFALWGAPPEEVARMTSAIGRLTKPQV